MPDEPVRPRRDELMVVVKRCNNSPLLSQMTNAGPYQVVITNYFGAATSSVANLTVYQPPSIVSQSGDMALQAGATATVSASIDAANRLFRMFCSP